MYGTFLVAFGMMQLLRLHSCRMRRVLWRDWVERYGQHHELLLCLHCRFLAASPLGSSLCAESWLQDCVHVI